MTSRSSDTGRAAASYCRYVAILEDDEDTWIPRLMYRLSAVEAVGGFVLLLFASDWVDALTIWLTAALTYMLAGRAERLEAD